MIFDFRFRARVEKNWSNGEQNEQGSRARIRCLFYPCSAASCTAQPASLPSVSMFFSRSSNSAGGSIPALRKPYWHFWKDIKIRELSFWTVTKYHEVSRRFLAARNWRYLVKFDVSRNATRFLPDAAISRVATNIESFGTDGLNFFHLCARRCSGDFGNCDFPFRFVKFRNICADGTEM